MHRSLVFISTIVVWLSAGQRPAWAQAPALAVWDTTQSSATALAPEVLAAKTGWAQIPAAAPAMMFKGDAVLGNARLLAVVRKQAPAVEVYALGTGGAVSRLRLIPVSAKGERAARLDQVSLVENKKAVACLEVSGKTAGGTVLSLRLRLKRGEVALETEPRADTTRLRVDCSSRHVVLPDFFADDLLIDPTKIPIDTTEVPSDNFLLHLMGKGEALAMCVFENRDQDVTLTLAGQGDQRTITGSEIHYGKGKIWVALLEAPNVWHALQLAEADAGKITRLDWKSPFPAAWRCDLTRTNGLVDSWEMLLPAAKGDGFVKPSWLGSGEDGLPATRRRWTTVLGTFAYPCWIDKDGQGFVQPLKSKALTFRGPGVVYPINRVKQTPLDAYTVVDVMRTTLGVGPCEYILDLEGQKTEYKGRATCSVRDKLGGIYSAKEQKKKRAEVDKTLNEGLTFVTHIRGRITRYVEFGHQMRAYLAEQQKTHPELREFLTDMDNLTAEIDKRAAARAGKIKTPAHVASMNEEFRKTVLNDDGPDALKNCKQYTQALVVIGDNQDELSGECRWVVKNIRQQAGLRLALDPKVAAIARAIRARAQEALRNPANHEGARH